MKRLRASLGFISKTLLVVAAVLTLYAPMAGITVPIAFADTEAGAGPGGTPGSSTLSAAEVTQMTADIQYEQAHNVSPPFTAADATEKQSEITKGQAGQLSANALRALRDWDVAVQAQMKADAAAQTASSSAATAAAAAATAAAEANKCTAGFTGLISDFGCWISKLPNLLLAAIGYFMLALCGFILWICGVLFNWTVLRTVFQFATYFGNSAGMLIAWGVLRDVGNILLLFGFIFLGVATILNVNSHGHSASSNIPRLIIFALLLNFSLLSAEAVIDVSNAFASVLSSQAGVNCTTTSTESTSGTTNCANQGISGKALALVGLTSSWQADMGQIAGAANATIPTIITTYMGGSIFLIILAFVLLAASIMLISRAAILCFLIVTSPIGFAGMAIPPLEGLAKKWWQMLLSQAFYAPVLILCILVSFKIADSLSNGASLIGALQGGSADSMQVVLVFSVVIAFLMASLVAAKQMGAAGASFATDFSRKAVSFAPALAGRAVVGGGSALAQRHFDAAIGKAREGSMGKNFVGRGILNFASDTVGGTLSKARNNTYGGVIRSYDEENKFRKEQAGHQAHAYHKQHSEEDLAKAMAMPEGDADQIKAKDEKIQALLQKMSQQDIEDSKYLKANSENTAALVRNLSPKKFSAMINNDKLGEDKKALLTANRFGELRKEIANFKAAPFDPNNPDVGKKERDDAKTNIRKWSNEDLASLAKSDPNFFKEISTTNEADGDMLISTEQYDSLKKNEALTDSQRNTLNEHTRGGLLMSAISANNSADITKYAKKMQGEIADLPNFVVTRPEVVATFTKSKMAAIGAKNKLSDDDKTGIMDTIRSLGEDHATYKAVDEYLKQNKNAAGVWGTLKEKKSGPNLNADEEAQVRGLTGGNL